MYIANRADRQVVACDLRSLNTSHYVDNSADRLSQNNLIQNFLSNLFEQDWQITKHTDSAAITSKWKIKFRWTLAQTEIENMTMKSRDER